MDQQIDDPITLLAALKEPPKLTDPRLGGTYSLPDVYNRMAAAGAAGAASYEGFPEPREPVTSEGLRRLWEIAKGMA
jgi:hypothetical protein